MKFRYEKDKEELVVSEASRIEYHQLGLWLTRHVKGYRFMPAFKMGVWNGQQSYFKNGRISLGLWKEAMRGCKEIDAPFVLENKEDFPINRDVTLEKVQDFCKVFFKYHKVKNKAGELVPFMPYDHQIESAYKILKNRYCMAEVATSGGKSLIISIVMFYTLKKIKPDAKFLIIVPSITLVTQFYDNIVEYNYGVNNILEMREKKSDNILNNSHLPCDVRIEEVMSERPRKWSGTLDANVYIGTYQSLEKWPKEFFKQFENRFQIIKFSKDELDITNFENIRSKILFNKFDVVLNCAAYNYVDDAEENGEKNYAINAMGPKLLADICNERNIKLVHISTDYAYASENPIYFEKTQLANPCNAYGRAKVEGENNVREFGNLNYLVIRTSWLYGLFGGNFFKTMMKMAKEKRKVRIVNDQFGQPTWTLKLSKYIFHKIFNQFFMPMVGLEPTRLASLPPQDSVSTNFTTSAF